MKRRLATRASTALAAPAVLVVAHDLFFLLSYGRDYRSAMARTGDGEAWTATVAVVLAASLLLALVAAARLVHLALLLRRFDRRRAFGFVRVAAYRRLLLSTWTRLLVASLVLFVLQENYERWSAGLAVPGLAVAGLMPVAVVPVFALVSFLFAAVVALFRLGIETLESLVAGARARPGMATRAARPVRPERSGAPASIIGRNLAGRAPPFSLPA